MPTVEDGCQYRCAVEATLDVIGGKWKGVLLFHLLDGPKRFGEFRRLLPGITQRMLTLQLRELERDGIVHREVFTQVPPKVEYSLTRFGRSLSPVLETMREWGEEYGDTITTMKAGALPTGPGDEAATREAPLSTSRP